MSICPHRHPAAPKTPGGRHFLRFALPGTVAAFVWLLASFVGRSTSPDPDPAVDTGGLAAAWHAGALSRIAQQEYHASLTPAGLQAPNRAQNLRTWFREGGIDVVPRVPRDDAPAWSFGWRTTRWGRGERLAAVRTEDVAPRAEGARVTYAYDGLDEWYENRKEGLEQGFTLHARPEGQGPLVVAGRVGGGLQPQLSAEAGAIDLLDAGGALVLRHGGLHVYGADHRALTSHFELAGDEVAIVVDDRGARYPITIDPLLTAPSWTGEANQINASFGTSVATAGDVNGDGYSDVIVGAWIYDNGEADEGRAFVYLGSAAGLTLAPAWTAESNQAGAAYGYSVATAGDVNGDGFSDVLVGAFRYDNGESNEGRAYVYLGSASGLSLTAAWTAEANQANAAYGLSVSTAGDVNGDGFSDVIVGAVSFDNGEVDEGRALVYLGSATGLNLTAAWSAEPNQAGAQYGASVALAGDVNGDGFSDVIVGASWFDNGESNEGRAFVYHGSASGLAATAAWVTESNQALAEFGQSVSTAGDVNGDGFSDVIVGAYGYDNGHLNEGRAFSYHGSATGLSTTPAWSAESNQVNARFGFRVATAGDINGDGFADVIVGAHEFDNVENQEGRAFVYQGSATGLNTATVWTAEPNQADARFGIAVATAGDVNGDGFSDVIVGADMYDNGEFNEGRAFVYLGSGNAPGVLAPWSPESNQTNAYFGRSVASAGDVNGDGFSDVIVGASGFDNGQTDEGAAFVYYGAAAGPAATPSWSAEGNQPGANFGLSVASAGDVNGDGYADVIVGAPNYANGEENEGRAFVYLGSAAGLAATAAWFTESNRDRGYLGRSVACAGDVNGDGYADVIIGVPYYANPGGYYPIGEARVYHGSPSGLASTPGWTAQSGLGETSFGTSVASAGDVNGDGYSDVIVGEPRYFHAAITSGRALVYHGSPSGLASTPAWTVDSGKPESWFGISVASAGDVNGDGFSDVVAGCPFYYSDSTGTGAFVYHGSASGLQTTAAWTTQQPQAATSFGYSVASAGDVNGDGFSDLIVGAPRYDGISQDNGRAFLYLGSPVGLSLPQVWGAQSIQASAQLGESVASAGDVNGDGYADVVVGSYLYDNGESEEGRATVYYGNGGSGRVTLARQMRTDGSTPIAPGGRSNSPAEFQIRANILSTFGRTRLLMEHEVKPRGTLLNGTGFVPGALTDTGSDGALDVSRLVFGLIPDTQYHWRVRARYDMVKTPFQRYGPWIHLPQNGSNEASLRTAPAASGVDERPAESGPLARLLPVTPNPFRAHARLSYTLPERGAVQLAIYDVAGREVVALVDETQDAGSHIATWDGRGDGSRTVAAGVYFARLAFGSRVEARKLVLTP